MNVAESLEGGGSTFGMHRREKMSLQKLHLSGIRLKSD